MSNVVCHTEGLTIGYLESKKKKISIQSDLNVSLYEGEFVCLIGPNGAGKSTLIRTLCGLQEPLCGDIQILDKQINKQSIKEKAELISFVLTDRIESGNLSVYDIVSIGRHPYTNWFGRTKNTDQKVIKNALSQVHIEQLLDRKMYEISDGEKQRVLIAKALVQDTPLIILDEPTAHLDLPNRIEIMSLLRKLAHQTGKSILLSTHELDLALQISDKIWLMKIESGIETYLPKDLMSTNKIQEAFGNFSFRFENGKVVIS